MRKTSSNARTPGLSHSPTHPSTTTIGSDGAILHVWAADTRYVQTFALSSPDSSVKATAEKLVIDIRRNCRKFGNRSTLVVLFTGDSKLAEGVPTRFSLCRSLCGFDVIQLSRKESSAGGQSATRERARR